MSKYTALYHKIWSDKKFRNLSSDAKLLFIYLLCYEGTNICGIFEIHPEIVDVIVPTIKGFKEHIKELDSSYMVKFDQKDGIIWVINKFKFTYTKSGSVIMGCIHELNHLNHPFRLEFIDKYHDILKPYIHLLNGFRVNEDLLNVDQVSNLNKINWGKERIKKFYSDRGYNEKRIDEIIKQVL